MAAGITVRPATEADAGAIVELFAAVVAEGRWLGAEGPVDRAEHLERVGADLAEPDRSARLVAVAGDRIVGQVRVGRSSFGVADLSMYVAAGWRRRGVGAALVEAALRAAGDLAAHKVALQAWPDNEAALALYTRFGFTTEGSLRRHYRRRNGELWDAVVMGLVLDDGSPGGPRPSPP